MLSRDRSLRASTFKDLKWSNIYIILTLPDLSYKACQLIVPGDRKATAVNTDLAAAQNKTQTNMRILRGHTSAITALHCVTRKEVWDLVGDREDAGFFISGSTDCTVSFLLS
jgi:hypothetical protein